MDLNQKKIIRNIIIIPILLVVMFVLISYLILNNYIIKENEQIWDESIKKSFYDMHKNLLSNETKKIESFINEEARISNELLFSQLRETLKFKKSIFENISYKRINIDNFNAKFNVRSLKELDNDLILLDNSKYIASYLLKDSFYEIAYTDYHKFLKELKHKLLLKVLKISHPDNNYILILNSEGYEFKLINGSLEKEHLLNNDTKLSNDIKKSIASVIADTKKKKELYFTLSSKYDDALFHFRYLTGLNIIIGYGISSQSLFAEINKDEEIKNNLLKKMMSDIFTFAFLISIMVVSSILIFGKKVIKYILDVNNLYQIEREKSIQLIHEQNLGISSKEDIINNLVPIGFMDNNLKFNRCTVRFADLFEVEESKIYGKTLFHLFTNENKARLKEFISNPLNTELRIEDALFKTFKNKDIWLSVTISQDKKYLDGVVYTILCEEVGEKVSLMKKYDREMQKNHINQQIILQQSKLTAIGATVDSIAHQWKQPLAVVMGEIGDLTLKTRKYKKGRTIDLSVLEDNLNRIESTIVFLSQTVEAFNTFYDADEEYVFIEISQIVKDTFSIMIPSSSAKNYEINYNIEDEVYAFGPKGLYQQVILTIIDNAIDAFRHKNIRKRIFNITIKSEGNYNYLMIEDNAGGIEPEIIDRIFELNFSTKKKGNSGLGLYLAKIVLSEKFSEGSITAVNTEVGACFTIKTKNIHRS